MTENFHQQCGEEFREELKALKGKKELPGEFTFMATVTRLEDSWCVVWTEKNIRKPGSGMVKCRKLSRGKG